MEEDNNSAEKVKSNPKKMPRRRKPTTENDEIESERPFSQPPEGSCNDCKQTAPKLDLNKDPSKLIENIEAILQYQKNVIPYLYANSNKGKAKSAVSMIQESLSYLDNKLQEAKQVKVSLATFGAMGKGKSFFLNHILNHGLEGCNKGIKLLPIGVGDSVTSVPTKIKYGQVTEIMSRQSDGSQILLKRDVPLQEIQGEIRKAFDRIKSDSTDVVGLDVIAPLPVFNILQKMVKKNCMYPAIEVDLEFVDLPGCGDNYGNKLIGKELDQVDVILVFKDSESGRQFTLEDLKSIFERRKVFEYENRPKFVIIENSSKYGYKAKGEDISKSQGWKKLVELHNLPEDERKNEMMKNEYTYKVIYGCLPLITAKELIDKFREESTAIVFSSESNEFMKALGEAIVDHVNKVLLKKNLHPVVRSIYKDANNRKKRIGALLRKDKYQKQFKPLKRLSFKVKLSIQQQLFQREVMEFSTAKTDLVLHQLVIKRLRENMPQLLLMLRSSFEDHYVDLLHSTVSINFLENDVSYFAKMKCDNIVDTFMKEKARNFINSRLTRLARHRITSWTDCKDDEQRKELLTDHINMLLHELSKSLSKGSRGDGLVKLLDSLRTSIDDMVKETMQDCCFTSDYDEGSLKDIKKCNREVSRFCLKRIKEVNPYVEPQTELLNSNDHFPDPFDVLEKHEARVIPDVNHDSLLKSVTLERLRKKLGLTSGSLTAPEGYDDQWARILLSLLCSDKEFHNLTVSNPFEVYDLNSLPSEVLISAKEQLFAHRKSTVECKIVQDGGIFNDTIKITFNGSKDGLVASIHPELGPKLEKLRSVSDLTKELVPIFIPSIHYGPSKERMGNLYLEEDPWESTPVDEDEEDNEEGDKEDGQKADASAELQPKGLEKLPATIFCVMEPNDEKHFRETLKNRSPVPDNTSFFYVILPQNKRGIGVSRAITKCLADALKLPQYWTVDDDIKMIHEYNKNSGGWKRCTTRRALLYVQKVYMDCIKKVVRDMSLDDRDDNDVSVSFPKWARKGKRTARRMLGDDNTFTKLKNDIFQAHQEFTEKDKENDCKSDTNEEKQQREKEWDDAKERCIEQFQNLLLTDNFKKIGRISIGNQISGWKQGYYCRSDMHYRKSLQNYQMVLHNTAAIEGFNYVADEVILGSEDHNVDQQDLRDLPHLGMKNEDKSFCKALSFYGVVGYQLITVALKSEKLLNAFGRIGNSYKSEDEAAMNRP